jgi:hypothetical protein
VEIILKREIEGLKKGTDMKARRATIVSIFTTVFVLSLMPVAYAIDDAQGPDQKPVCNPDVVFTTGEGEHEAPNPSPTSTYTNTVKNNQNKAASITVIFTLQPGHSVAALNPPATSVTADKVTWACEAFAAGETRNFRITVKN